MSSGGDIPFWFLGMSAYQRTGGDSLLRGNCFGVDLDLNVDSLVRSDFVREFADHTKLCPLGAAFGVEGDASGLPWFGRRGAAECEHQRDELRDAADLKRTIDHPARAARPNAATAIGNRRRLPNLEEIRSAQIIVSHGVLGIDACGLDRDVDRTRR